MKVVNTINGVEIRWSMLHKKYIAQGVHYATQAEAEAALEPRVVEIEPLTLSPVKVDKPEEE